MSPINRRMFCVGLGASVLPFASACSSKKKKTSSSESEDAGPPTSALRASQNNLKQIGIAFHSHNDAMRIMPAGYIDPRTKQIGLSWRVQILPYIEELTLYKKFRLNEAWDSEHNLRLLSQMPKVYAPTFGEVKPGYTYYQGFACHYVDAKGQELSERGTSALPPSGPCPFPDPRARQQVPNPNVPADIGSPVRAFNMIHFTDGLSNTFLVVEAGEAVPWTKPADIQVKVSTPDQKLLDTGYLKLGGMFGGEFHVLMGDGSVFRIKKDVAMEKLKNFISHNDGMNVNFDEITGGSRR